MDMKKAGVLGSGIVAKTLASGLKKYGYEVMMGTRDSSKLQEWNEKSGTKAQIGSFAEAAAFGELIVLAAKGDIAFDVLKLAGTENLNGKTIIDACNPIDHTRPPVNGVLRYFTNMNESLMEQFQKAFPSANFVKAFNSVGNAFMVNPNFAEGKPSMFICGNNENAKSEVKSILELFGWETEDMGQAESAGSIESLCILWCIPGMQKGQWTHAFKLLKK